MRRPCESVQSLNGGHPLHSNKLGHSATFRLSNLSTLHHFPEARSRIPQTSFHRRHLRILCDTRTRAGFLILLGTNRTLCLLSDLRLLSERCCYFLMFWSLLHCDSAGWTTVFYFSHTLPSKRWVVRVSCIYLKMAEASRPGIVYTYRLILFLLCDRLIASSRSFSGGWVGGIDIRNLVSHFRKIRSRQERSRFLETVYLGGSAYLFHDLGGYPPLWSFRLRGAGWYRLIG